MNSIQHQNMEPNQQQTITSYIVTTTNTNQALNPQTTQNNQNTNNSKIITEITEKKYELNSVPFKSLMEENDKNDNDIIVETPIFSTSNISKRNALFNNNLYNPFATHKESDDNSKVIKTSNTSVIINQNQQMVNNSSMNNYLKNATYDKKNKSHNIRKTINNFNENISYGNKSFKIKTFKSQEKPKGRITSYETNLIGKDDALVLNNNIITEENENYKLLVKRIASQLKRKIRPPTKGYFYMSIIRSETYIKKVKGIAKKMKIKVKPSTHGFFYQYIEREKKHMYKLLVKRIAMQLKKRIKFPTCKILKIYEPYRMLIKKIASELNKSRKQRMAMNKTTTTTTTTTTIIQNNNIDNTNNNNLQQNNQINNISNNGINTNLNNITEITKTEIVQSNINNSNHDIEKIEIDEEENPKIKEQKITTIENSGNNNINNGKDLIDSDKNSSIANSIKFSGSNFSFNQQSNNNQQQIINEEIIEKIGHRSHKSHVNPFNNDKAEIISDNALKVIKEGKYVQSFPSRSKKDKKINFNLSIFKKDDDKDNNLRLSKEDKNIQSKTYDKEVTLFNIDNDNGNDINDEPDLNVSQDLNVSLSNIEITKSNFIHDFKNFLDKVNIKIVNNFPVSLNEKNKYYFQQSNFWILIINYLFYQNSSISLYTIISLLEQYILWCTDINLENFTSIKERIVEYINTNYKQYDINQFLFMNKFESLDDIFKKYEKAIKDKENNNYKEVKLNNICISHNNEGIDCQCELCTNDEACIKKVSDINKNRINISDKININYINKNDKISQNDISNNEEIFYKGYSEKKQNIFNKSKTIVTETTNLQLNFGNEEILNDLDKDDDKKNYKNISHKKDNTQIEKEKNDADDESNKEVKERDEKEEDSDSDNKNKKKIKKTKKVKNKNKNKKKKEATKSDIDEIEVEEKELDEKKEEERSMSKSKKKKKDKKKKYLEKAKDEKQEDSEEKDDKDKFEEKEEEEDSSNDINSKRKKSKTPNRKKNKKH